MDPNSSNTKREKKAAKDGHESGSTAAGVVGAWMVRLGIRGRFEYKNDAVRNWALVGVCFMCGRAGPFSHPLLLPSPALEEAVVVEKEQKTRPRGARAVVGNTQSAWASRVRCV